MSLVKKIFGSFIILLASITVSNSNKKNNESTAASPNETEVKLGTGSYSGNCGNLSCS
jgi:hypothetical protein